MVLVIMAAGMGSRYGGLKQIEPVGPNGEYIIDYSIYDAYQAGIRKVIFIIKRENYDIFVETIGKRIEERMDVSYIFQEIDNLPSSVSFDGVRVKPWGTTHAILACKDVIHEPFIVINADDFYGRDAFIQMSTFLKEHTKSYAMVGYILQNTITENGDVSRGVCRVDSNHDLIDIMECKKVQKNGDKIQYFLDDTWHDLDSNSIVSMNFWGFTPDLFLKLEEEFIMFFDENRDFLDTMECLIPISIGNLQKKKQCKVKVLHTKDQWYGITYKEDKERIVSAIYRFIDEGIYPKYLWK